MRFLLADEDLCLIGDASLSGDILYVGTPSLSSGKSSVLSLHSSTVVSHPTVVIYDLPYAHCCVSVGQHTKLGLNTDLR